MVRKFLYLVAIATVLVIAGLFGMRLFAPQLTRMAYVPSGHFVTRPALSPGVYENPQMWLARPGTPSANLAAWLPKGLTDTPDEPLDAAVFFVHPTSFLAKTAWNAPLEDSDSTNRARVMVRGMASPFNRSNDIWAPRYRQATFGAFLTNGADATAALDLAYGDVSLAFDAFLAAHPSGPIVLAGHSQGALHVVRLLKDRVAGTPLAGRIVAAYAIGWPISLAHDLPALGLTACERADQAGCIVGWSSYGEPADPSILLSAIAASTGYDGQPRGDSGYLCTNPLTGTPASNAPASANLGTLVPSADLSDGIIVKGMVPARCDNRGLLLIGSPPTMGPFVLQGNNYHVYDIPLFWMNLREDVSRRAKAWRTAASGRQ